MADQPRDPSKSKKEAEKKQPETVLLDLRGAAHHLRGSDDESPSSTPTQGPHLLQGLSSGSDWSSHRSIWSVERVRTHRIAMETPRAPRGTEATSGVFS